MLKQGRCQCDLLGCEGLDRLYLVPAFLFFPFCIRMVDLLLHFSEVSGDRSSIKPRGKQFKKILIALDGKFLGTKEGLEQVVGESRRELG